MKILVTELVDGDRLSAHVFNHYGLHVLSAETVLRVDEINKLRNLQIEYVDIYTRPSNAENTNEALKRIQQACQPLYIDAARGMRQLFVQAVKDKQIDEAVIENSFVPLLQNVHSHANVVDLLLSLQNDDEYTYQHCVQVGMLSYFLSKWLGRGESEAVLTGKAGYLHDIGKSYIKEEILSKPGKLDENEFSLMKKHTIFGYEILNQSIKESPIIALAALQHHERMDGSGYPLGIVGAQIQPAAKIVAIADIFSAMISSRVYQKKRNMLDVMQELYRLSFDQIDPIVTHTLIRMLLPNFIGKKVTLKSGEQGMIIMNNQTDFFRPLIQVNNEFIDLSQTRQLQIETIEL